MLNASSRLIKEPSKHPFCFVVVFCLFLLCVDATMGYARQKLLHPDGYGLGMTVGNAYDPRDAKNFILLTGFALYDHDELFPQDAPDPLWFKIHAGIGATTDEDTDLMITLGIDSLYYIEAFATENISPYLEGSIGIIYTDYRVEGQGSNVNFNPEIGIGTDFGWSGQKPFYAAVKLFHISNAGLHEDNRGTNAVIFTLGRYF